MGKKILSKKMHRRDMIGLVILFVLGFVLLMVVLLDGKTIAVLDPKGIIASEQRNLLVFATALSMVVILPVYALTIFIVWRYRASNPKATYAPEWDGSKILESIWWGVPILLIIVLSVVTWRSSYQLDPFKPLVSSKKPLTVQVVALQWKWLFIYPEQGVATLNYVQFPEDTPITFEISADAPMNSFWIPQLGGQIYAMNGMVTKLHLEADEIGDYRGTSANISGEGFAGMTFTAKASSQTEFDSWASSARASQDNLNTESYNALSQPSKNDIPKTFALAEPDLHRTIVMKYMAPASSNQESHGH